MATGFTHTKVEDGWSSPMLQFDWQGRSFKFSVILEVNLFGFIFNLVKKDEFDGSGEEDDESNADGEEDDLLGADEPDGDDR